MLFEQRFWPGIRDGSVTRTYRRWKRQQVLAGRRYRTPGGIVEVETVDVVEPSSISDADAQRSGYADAGTLRRELRGNDELPTYQIVFHVVDEPDPREQLAATEELSDDDVAAIDRRLARLDQASTHGPWTSAYLDVIAQHPATRAADLAAMFGRETQPFKTDVRKLKNLGLTISLERGYRLSPRGIAYLTRRDQRLQDHAGMGTPPRGRWAVPGDGTIQRQLTRGIAVATAAPLLVGILAIVALVAAGAAAPWLVFVAAASLGVAIASFVFGNRGVRRLGVRFEQAGERVARDGLELPAAIDRARSGDASDDAEIGDSAAAQDELDALVAAVERERRAAVTAVAEASRGTRQMNELFVDLGRRNQALVGRALDLLAEVEIVHAEQLLRRLNRHAASALLLAGADPGAAGDTLASAGAGEILTGVFREVDAGTRIEAGNVDAVEINGRFTGAVTHIVAELLDNATQFSPPETKVRVEGRRRPDAYVLSIVDRGIGFAPDALAEANERLRQFKPAAYVPARRIGLTVVAELARRNGVSVRLEANPDGGTSARVILPNALLVTAAGLTVPAEGADQSESVEDGQILDLVAVEAASAVPPPPPAVTTMPPPPVLPLRPEPARTASGLERRVPGTHLPERGPRRDVTAPMPPRSADGVRRSLRSFQHGTERALAERDDERVTDEGEEHDR